MSSVLNNNSSHKRWDPTVSLGSNTAGSPKSVPFVTKIKIPSAWQSLTHLPAELLFALADGMGGYEQGSRASQLAIDQFFQSVNKQPAPHHHRQVRSVLRKGVEAANLAVCNEARLLGVHRMGTTLTAAQIIGSQLFLAHIGDSRAYLIREQQANCLTSDHTVVGDLLRLHVLTADQVRTHARRSILNRAVGLALFVRPDLLEVTLQPDDWIILCSDGVWSVIEDDEFAALASESSHPDAVCQQIIDQALQRRTDDNISVIAVHIHQLLENGNHQAVGRRLLNRLWRYSAGAF